MAINWDKYEKEAKKVTQEAKKINSKTYVGGKSASDVSKKAGSKSNTKKTTTKLFPNQKEIAKGMAESAISLGKAEKEVKKAQEKAKKDGLKELKKTTSRSASEIANDMAKSIDDMHKATREAKKKDVQEKYKIKEKKSQADEKRAASKLATKSDKQANAAAKREHRSTPTKTSQKQLDSGAKKVLANSKPYAFISSAEDEFANNSPLGIGYAWAKGEKMADGGGQYDTYTTLDNAIQNRSIRKAGENTGIGGSYLLSYGLTGGLTGAAAKAVTGTGAAQKTIAKLAGSKLGQKLGAEFVSNAANSATKDLIADATVGTVMNSGQARSLGLEGADFAKYMGQQALIDFGLGALGELAPVAYRAVRGTKLARQAGNIVDAATDGATATAKAADNVADGVVDAVNGAAEGSIQKTQKQRIKEARAAKAKANREATAKTQHDSMEQHKFDEAISTSEKKSTTRKGNGVKLLKSDSGFNSYMAEKYGDIYAIENVANKNGQTLSKFLLDEYDAYRYMPDDMKLNYEASENMVADVEAKTGNISESEKREFSIYLQHKYGDFSNAEAAAKKQGMDMQTFFRKEKALYGQAKAAGKTTADTVEDAVTGETIPNPAKQTEGTTVDPITGETIPNTVKQTEGTTVDPETGETIPNTFKEAKQGKETIEVEEVDLTPESKKKVYDAVEKRTGVKVVEENLGDVDGFYQDGVIHININSKQPKYTVLKHELTHYMQTSKNYDAFAEFIFDSLRRKGFDIDELRSLKKSSYADKGIKLNADGVDFELVAEYCGEFLFNSQKSIDRFAREHYSLATWLVDWMKDTIAKIGKSDDAKWLIDAQRKYEYALRNAKPEVNGEKWNMYVRAGKFDEQIANNAEKSGKTAEEIKKELNMHRGFKDDWLTEIDDSGATLDKTQLDKAKNGEYVSLRNLLVHKNLWRKVGEDFDGYRVTFGRLNNGDSGAEINHTKKIITISDECKNNSDSSIMLKLLHEVQHALQDYYGLPHGANKDLWHTILSKNDAAYKEAVAEVDKELDTFDGSVEYLNDLTGIEVDIDYGDIRDLNFTAAQKYLDSFKRKAKRRGLFNDKVEDVWNQAQNSLKNVDFYTASNDAVTTKAYYNTAGELEANDVMGRAGMSKEARRKKMPRQKNENTRYVEDYGYFPNKSRLYVRATPEEIDKIKIEDHGKYKIISTDETKRDLNLHLGFNGKWLYEIDDSAGKFSKKASELHKELKDGKPSRSIPLKDAVDHPELWKRLEESGEAGLLDDYKFCIKTFRTGKLGEVNPTTKTITLSPDAEFSTMIHEIQHAIQDEQRLAGGASPEFWERKLAQYDSGYKHIQDRMSDIRGEILDYAERLDAKQRPKYGKDYKGLTERLFMSERTSGPIRDNIIAYYDYLEDAGNLDRTSRDMLSDMAAKARNLMTLENSLYDEAYDAYRNTAGEIEARDAAERLGLSDAERRATWPMEADDETLYTDDTFESYKHQFKRANKAKADKRHKAFFSTGENVIKDDALKKTSQNLYGEKGNKYVEPVKTSPKPQTEAPKAAANTELPKGKAKPADKLPTKNAKSATKQQTTGKAKSVSADAKNPDADMTYEQAAKRYETYQNGTPTKLPSKGDVSKAADTIIGSDVIGDETRAAIKENVDNFVKATKTNKVTIENVNAEINSKGLKTSIKNFEKRLEKGKRITEEDIAMGAELLHRLDEAGDYETALDVTNTLVEMMSQAGRTLQAANIFTSMTPYGKLRSIRRTVDKMSERYGKTITVDESLMKELFKEKDSAKSDAIKKKIFKEIWDQIPPSLWEKIDAIRYTAMLSSPKTHIRNVLGNGVMYIGKSLSDGVEAALEETVFKGKMERMGAMRTKSFLNPFSEGDRELKKKAGELFESVKDQLLKGTGKYTEGENYRPQDNRLFKSKVLETARKGVSRSLEYEDEKFMKANFEAAFAKICKANGLEVGELTAKEIRKYTDYAAEQALAATFRDSNALASAMNRLYRYANDTTNSSFYGKVGKGALKVGMDIAVPYRRTPANILKQALRYSPAGVVSGMGRIVAAKNADELLKGIEVLSNGIVGTPIVAAGAYMGYQGLVSGSVGNYSDKTASYNRMLGEQDYAINLGDRTITMDWMSPYSMPFFVGAELGNALQGAQTEDGQEFTATQLVDAMASITEPFLEMSMMQGLQDMITQTYEGNAAEIFVGNAMKSYATQFIPTLLSQIAKTIAKETSSTKTVSDGTVSGKTVTSMIAQLKNKVPVLYETNQPNVDVWGRTETKEDIWDYVRAGARNILSPSNVKDVNITDVDKEILSVYDSLDDDKASVIPTPAESSVEYKSTKYKMTNEQWTAYKKDIGAQRYSGLEKLFKTSEYKKASTEDKAKMIQSVYSDARNSAKKNFLISSGNMTEEEYAASTLTSKAAEKLIKSGKTTATKVVEAKETFEKSGASNKAILQAYVLYGRYDNDTIRAVGGYNGKGGYKISDNTLKEAKAVKNSGIGLTQLQRAYTKSDTNSNGSISKDEAVAYLNKTNYSQAQKRAIFDALMNNPETHNPY